MIEEGALKYGQRTICPHCGKEVLMKAFIKTKDGDEVKTVQMRLDRFENPELLNGGSR
jgi:uncharacterized protein (DUF983 family)